MGNVGLKQCKRSIRIKLGCACNFIGLLDICTRAVIDWTDIDISIHILKYVFDSGMSEEENVVNGPLEKLLFNRNVIKIKILLNSIFFTFSSNKT